MAETAEHLKTLPSPISDSDATLRLSTETCLSNDDVLAFAQGTLDRGRLEQANAHIDRCARCQQLVTEAVHALDAETVSEFVGPSWNCVFQPNTLLDGRFRIVRLIGRGGMGEVYEAFDTVLQERLALKTVTSTACDNALAVRSLKAEVQLARRISQANICRIHDFRTHVVEANKTEIHYLVMEFVEGECLGKKLREGGALPLALSQSIAKELLLGLRAAHQAGILHRDFKSDNVMLRTDPSGATKPVILDFGLAKALNGSGQAASTLTRDRGMVGTLGYMAPEQIEIAPLSAATDLYAFGVVWFEMLTGRLPFAGETPAAAAIARLHIEPVAPSTFNPDIPKWIDDVVLGCLSRHREDRYATAEEVLSAFVDETAPSTIPTPPPLPTHRRRRLFAVGAAAIIAAFLAGFALVGSGGSRQSPRMITRSATPETAAEPSSHQPPLPVISSSITVTPVVGPPSPPASALATSRSPPQKPPPQPPPPARKKVPDWLPP